MIRNVLLVVALIPTVLFLLAVLVAKLRDAFEPRWVTVAVAALDEPMLFESRSTSTASTWAIPADLPHRRRPAHPSLHRLRVRRRRRAECRFGPARARAYRPTTTPAWVTATSTTSNWVPDDHFDQGGCAVGVFVGVAGTSCSFRPVPPPGMELTRGVIACVFFGALIGAPLGTVVARQ